MINKVILVGNLGKEPEVRHFESGNVVAKFSVATNENYRDKAGEWQTKTEWHDVVVWRGLAERAEKVLSKGSLVYIEGKLTHRKWQDDQGNNRYSTEVVAAVMRTLDKRENSSDRSYNNLPSESDGIVLENSNIIASTSKPPSQASTPEENDDLPF